MKYFAYGSNLCISKLRGVTPSAQPVTVAKLVGFKLAFHKRSTEDGSGKANALRTGDGKDCVWGVVYDIADAEEPDLDKDEGGYDKVDVTVHDEAGKFYAVRSYFAKPKTVEVHLRPYTWYLRFLKEGAYHHNLPQQYIQEHIEQVEATEDPNKERDADKRAIICNTSSSWATKKLGDIAKIDKCAVQPNEIQKGTIFVGLENINESGTIDAKRTLSNGEVLSTKLRFTSKHILYGKLRPYLKKIARPNKDGICSTDILPILPSNQIDRDYLYYFLRQPELVKLATERCTGANLPRLSPSILADFKISFPPLAIQQQIAAVLDKADAAREKRRQANQLTEQFLQSAFPEMFGDPVTNPKGWETKLMEEVCSKVADGTHFSPPIIDGGIPYITAKHLKKHGLDFYIDPTYISEEHHRDIYKRCNPVFGDVIYIKDGVTTGIAAVNRYNFEFSMLSSLALLKPDRAALTPEYLSAYLNTPSVKNSILRQMAGGAIKRLTVAKIKKLPVVLPDIQLQQKFAALVEKVESLPASDGSIRQAGLRAKQRKSEKELENLFNSLMQRAFRGELVEQGNQ